MELRLQVVRIGLENEIIYRVGSSVHGILDRAHPLLGFAHALQVEVSAVFAQDPENLDRAGPDGEENPAEAIVLTLLINIDLHLPDDRYVCLTLQGRHLLLLLLLRFVFLRRWVLVSHGARNFIDELWCLLEEEIDDVVVSSHDCNVHRACAFFVFLVVDAD